MCGASVSALAGLALEQVFAGAAPALAQHVHEAASGATIKRGELSLSTEQGGKRLFDYLLVPIMDGAGKVEAIAGTARDISARVQAQAGGGRNATQ